MRIEIRTCRQGAPRELWVDGLYSGELNLAELAAFVAALAGQLGQGKGRAITLFAGHTAVDLSWAEAHALAESALSTMRWG
jgi:hypothetical protein